VNQEHFSRLNADLGFEFHLFALEHSAWMSHDIPAGAIVARQTDDEAFNAWSRRQAESHRAVEQPSRPVVLVHIRELQPPHSRIVRADAELIAS
jgi:hypothetical protein